MQLCYATLSSYQWKSMSRESLSVDEKGIISKADFYVRSRGSVNLTFAVNFSVKFLPYLSNGPLFWKAFIIGPEKRVFCVYKSKIWDLGFNENKFSAKILIFWNILKIYLKNERKFNEKFSKSWVLCPDVSKLSFFNSVP